MGLEDTSTPAGEAGQLEGAPPETVKPLRSMKRERDAMLHRIKRKMPHLSEAKLTALDKASPAELERILEEGLSPRPAQPVVQVQVQLEPGQKPGWPPPSAMKEWAELATLLSLAPIVGLEAGAQKVPALQHWANAFMPRDITLGSVTHKIEPQKQLAEGLAGIAAKYLGSGPGSSPEASIAVAFLCVAAFGAMEYAKAAQQSEDKREAKAAETQG